MSVDFYNCTAKEKILHLRSLGWVLSGSNQYPSAKKKIFPPGQRGRYIKKEFRLTIYEGRVWKSLEHAEYVARVDRMHKSREQDRVDYEAFKHHQLRNTIRSIMKEELST